MPHTTLCTYIFCSYIAISIPNVCGVIFLSKNELVGLFPGKTLCGIRAATSAALNPSFSNSTSSATLTNTSSGTAISDGWNLVGNPYPSEIDWSAAAGWTKTGLDNAIYFWDQANNRFASFVSGIGTNGATRYIPCMQGFYVHVTSPGTGTLAMNNNVRSSVENRDNWRTASQDVSIRLKAENGLINDETVIRFSDEATEDFDPQIDAYKLVNKGTTPSISTKFLTTDYAVNSMPLSTLEKIIPVKLIAGSTGTHVISVDMTGLDETDSIILENRVLGVRQDLTLNPTYSCSLVQGDTTSRFFINYKKQAKTTGVTTPGASSGISIYGQEQTVTVVFGSDHNSIADIAISDVTGNLVYKVENEDVSSGRASIVLPQVMSGIYIVKAQTADTATTQQVFLSK